MIPLVFRILAMDCSEEVTVLTRALLPLVGLETRLHFDILQRKLRVDIAGFLVTSEQVIQAINATGLRPIPRVSKSVAFTGRYRLPKAGAMIHWGIQSGKLTSISSVEEHFYPMVARGK